MDCNNFLSLGQRKGEKSVNEKKKKKKTKEIKNVEELERKNRANLNLLDDITS